MGQWEAPVGQTAPAVSAVEPVLRRVLSRYRLEVWLGAGSGGALYRATDLKFDRTVAIKSLDRQLGRNEEAKARFLQQALAASDLEDPNIAKIQEVGEEDGELFIALAADISETLERHLERGPIPFQEAQAILRQLCFGLEAAHDHGLIHQHLTPASVLITGDGTVKIFDFGLSELVQAAPASESLPYLSPEQLRGGGADLRSDLWSLGVVGYQLLAGARPFQASSNAAMAARIFDDKPLSLSTVSGVPGWLAELISLLLRKNPAERPQSVNQVIQRLEEGSSSDCAVPAVELAGSGNRSSAVRVALALGIGLLLAGGVFYCHWPI
jgi:serine/threonine-protein kinase